ncbi:Golgi transport complex subunit 3 [Tieghemiomyces parasiticus]|uniref:Conserved oligomeric Golgi complex subunit 3 n=1 Tax=Tieghemiomyces parasiticus TaxID=78921 RepID=A0A9W7ZNG5_9FUNG|nr:Golgi transport complex subunit 3 [Tieghemiomyces parasiticus]
MNAPDLPSAATESTTDAMVGLAVTQPIDTTEKFLDWLTKVEVAITRGQESKYSQCLDYLRTQLTAVERTIIYIDAVSTTLDDMKGQHQTVERKTRNLQTQGGYILQEQSALNAAAELLDGHLSYFNDLETITKLMHAPGDAVCLHENFLPYIRRLEECIAHLEQTPAYKDLELYLMRFQQCLTRGMTLIKMYFVKTVRALGSEASTKMTEAYNNKGGPDPNLAQFTTPLYVHFRTVASTLQPLVYELEASSRLHSDYRALLSDCASAYTSTRSQLLSTRVQGEVAALAQQHKDRPVDAVHQTFTFLTDLLSQEYQLYHRLFDSESQSFGLFLEGLGAHLYHQFRPTVVRETDHGVLCDVSQAIQAYVALIREPATENGSTSNVLIMDMLGNELPAETKAVHLRPLYPTAIKLLTELNNKASYRTEQFIDQRIRNYQVPDAELQDVLDHYRKTQADLASPDIDIAEVRPYPFPPVEAVRDTLGKVYSSVDSTKFGHLAHKAVSMCLATLKAFSKKLAAADSAVQPVFDRDQTQALQTQLVLYHLDFEQLGLEP